MRAVITVMGNDKPGIIAAVTANLAANNVNILDISQTTMQGIFTMIMLVDLSKSTADVSNLEKQLNNVGNETGVSISVQHEDIFNSMHKV